MKKGSIFFFGFLLFVQFLFVGGAWGQTYYNMSSGNYTCDFADIANWTNNFASGVGASNWSSVAVNSTGSIPDGVKTTVSSATFTTTTSGGIQKGIQNLYFLSTGSTSNGTSIAADLLLNFTGRNAGTISFDFSCVFNSTGDRGGTLKVYTSTNGTSWTELSGASVSVVNNVTSSGSKSSIVLPSSFNGSSTARIRFYQYSDAVGSSGSRPKISIDNLSVTSTSTSPCSGTPLPGNTLASINPVVSGSSTVLSLQNATTGSGVTYQWQSSPDNNTWTNVASAGTSATYTATPTSATYYRCNVTCSGNTGASNSLLVNLTYCNSTGPSTQGTDYFTNFTISNAITNINNISTYSTNGYGDFTSQSASQSAGSSVNFTMSSPGVSNGSSFGIFIDWNQDFDFNDTGESVYNSNGNISTNPAGSFIVPAGTSIGSKRMRIVVQDAGASVISCNNAQSASETEDYTFTVVAQPSCMVPTALTSSAISYQTATISWTAPTTGTAPQGYEYEVRTSGAAGSGATGLVASGTTTAPTTSANISGLSAATTYSYYVRSNCGGGDFSAWTSAGTFVTACDIPTNPGAISVSGSSSTGFTLTYAAASPVPTSYVLFNTTGTSTAVTTIPTLVNGTTYISGTAYTLGGTSYNCTSSSSTSPQSLSGGVSNTQYNYFLFSRNATNSCSGNPYYSSGITVSAVTCPANPTSPINSSITSSGATISWTASIVGGGYGTINYSLEVYTDAGYTAAISGSPFSMGTNVSQVLSGLAGATTYFYRIVATNGVCNSGYLTGSFTTLCIAEIAPTSTQTFATFTGSAPSPICWSEATSSSVTTSTTLTVANSEWLNSLGFANTGSNVGVKTNLYGTDSDDWLISNQIDLGNTAGVYRLKYDMAVTSYNGIVSQSTIGTHIVRVIISTDGGTTWSSANTLKTYTGAGTYSNTGVTEYINLSSYSGVIKIAFVATTSSNSPDIDFHLDNFAVETIPPPSITSFTPSQACVSGGQILTITGTNFNTITSVLFAGSSGVATLNGTIVSQTATTVSVVIPPNFVDGTIKIVNAIGNGVSATNLVALALPTASVSSSTICSGSNAVFVITGTANAVVTYNLNSGSNTTVTLDGSGNGSVTVTAPSTNQTINLVSVNLASTGCTKTLGTSATISLNAVTSITAQPTNQSAQIGANAQFNVVAAGTNLTYQWQEFDGTTYSNISGATTSTLTISSVIANDNGRVFRCEVTGTCGSQNSSNVTLTASSIGITTQPADATICNSGTTTLSMVTSGTITNYQWQISTDNQTTWTDISGANSSTLVLSGLSYSLPAKVYRCNLNNGTLYTNGATVTVYDQIAISSQPTTQTICTGTSSVSFSVTATGSNPIYQWQVSTNSGSTWANVSSGGTGPTYTLSNPADALNGSQYRVIVTGSSPCTAVTSNAVTLNLIYASIASSVASGCINTAFTLTATLNGNPTSPTYSWECPTSGSGATTAITSNPASITPTATGTFVYTLTAGSTECPTVPKTINYIVNALPTITTATATPSSVCSGSAITLTGSSVTANSGTAILGNGTAFGTGTTGTFLRQGNTVGNQFKTQYLFLASELQAAGLTSGNITGLTFDIYASGGGTASNLTFKIGNTNLTNLTTTYVTGLTQVFTVATYPTSGSVQTGLQSIIFNTPFNWDGTSNIILEACSQLATVGTDGTLRSTLTSFTSTIANSPSTTACSGTTGGGTFNERPNFRFNGQIGSNQTSSLTWSWNSIPAITTASGTTTETNTSGSATSKTYTVTATNATTGCVNTATTSAITIKPATIAPTATSSSQCGTATPTCSVSGTGTSGNTFKWYLAATGGTALVGQIASTLTNYPVSATTSFYVSESNGTCESARVQVTVTVTAAPTITAAASVNPVCSGSATSLSATSANSNYTYTWSNSAGTGATVSVNPTSATTYTVTGTDASGGVNNGCITTGSVSVNVNSIPTNISANSTSATICNGTSVNLTSSATSNSSNIVLLSPSGDGGFETGSTFAANNWLTATTGNNLWYVGNAVVNSGSRSAYISSNTSAGAAAVYNKGTARVSHLYRDVTFPSGATNITLSFNWQGVGESGYDYTAVYIVPLSVTPSAGVTLSSGQLGGELNGQSTWQTFSNNLNSNLAGTTQRLVFSWINDGSDGVDPAGVIDNVSITYTPPVSYSWASTPSGFTSTSQNPTGVAPVVNTTYTATATNSFGCTSSASVAVNVAVPSSQTIANNDYVWKGTTNTNWSTASNWVQFNGTTYQVATAIPNVNDNVFIPQNNTCVVNQPSISTGTVAVNAVYIEPSATVTGGSGSLDVKGNFTNNGIFTAGTGTVSFSGTTAQQITGATTFYNLTENNTTGLTLNSPVTISNNLTMTAGNITTTSTNLLTLGNSAPATLAWTSGKVVGPMKRWMAATTNSGAASSMFPLGNATRNTQASIEYTTAPTTAGYLEAKFIASTPATAATNAYATLTDQFNYVLDNVVSEGYWEINPSATTGVAGGTYTVKLEGEAISLATSTNASYTDVRVIKSPDPHTSWILQGDHGAATGTNSDFTVSRTGMSGYSFFAMAFPSAAPLPIELVSFAANCEDNNTVAVNWTTASEHNSDYYIVEKSRDGSTWNVLKTFPAAGNSTQLINYSVTDASDINGTVYYRLSQYDIDGASKVYDIVSTNCFAEKELTLLAYPNPSNGQFSLKIENAKVGKYDLAITDMHGKTIEEQSIDLESGTTVVKLNPLGLQPGVYMLQFMQNGNVLQYQKLVIE